MRVTTQWPLRNNVHCYSVIGHTAVSITSQRAYIATKKQNGTFVAAANRAAHNLFLDSRNTISALL